MGCCDSITVNTGTASLSLSHTPLSVVLCVWWGLIIFGANRLLAGPDPPSKWGTQSPQKANTAWRAEQDTAAGVHAPPQRTVSLCPGILVAEVLLSPLSISLRYCAVRWTCVERKKGGGGRDRMGGSSSKAPVVPVEHVDVDRYMGDWCVCV